MATLALSEELRCLRLNKALYGAAHVWAKNNIKKLIQAGDWKGAKAAIIARFELPDRELIFREKLAKIAFKPSCLFELFKLIQRIETNILPYESIEELTEDKLTTESLTKILKEFRDSLKEAQLDKELKEKEGHQVLAMLKRTDAQ